MALFTDFLAPLLYFLAINPPSIWRH
jgi:hypothetical protein